LDSVAPIFDIKRNFFLHYWNQHIWQPLWESQRVSEKRYPEKFLKKFFEKNFFLSFFIIFKSPANSRDVIFCGSLPLKLKKIDIIRVKESHKSIQKKLKKKNFFEKIFKFFFSGYTLFQTRCDSRQGCQMCSSRIHFQTNRPKNRYYGDARLK